MIRHGLTDWNVARRMQGRTDIPLNDFGREQARDAAERLADGPAFDAIVTSPLLRARETAEIIADRLGIGSVTEAPGLIERSFGEAEGMDVEVAHERWPDFLAAGMEPDSAVAERGLGALDGLADAHARGNVLAVSHGAFIRHLLAEISGVPRGFIPRIENVAVSRVRLDRTSALGAWRVDDVGGIPIERVRRAYELIEDD
nr:histidine phosphatase family protein [Leucobacter edaphi]